MKKIPLFIFLLGLLNISMYSQASKDKTCKPILLISGYKSGDTIAKADLDKLNGLSIYYPCTNTISNRIISYGFTLMTDPNSLLLTGIGSPLTNKMKGALKNASIGSKIYIDNVNVKDLKNSNSKIAGLTLFVGSGSSSTPIKVDSLKGPNGKIPSCDPIVKIGKYKDGDTITKNELNLINQLSAYFGCNTKFEGGCKTEIYYQIVSYEVSATINEKPFSVKCIAPDFPKEIKGQFREIKSTTKLFINNIQTKSPDGSLLEIPGVVLNISPLSKIGSTEEKNRKSKTNNFTKSEKPNPWSNPKK